MGIAIADPEEGIRCRYHQWREFHSASVIKVITLCALLHQLQGRENLSPYQADLAQAMITESDNDAQDTLWNEIGMTVEEAEHELIVATLRHTGGDKTRAAATLGIGLRTLYRKIQQYGIA